MKLALHYNSYVWTAIATATFSAIVGVGLLLTLVGHQRNLPLDDPRYVELKQELESDPQNPALQVSLRDLDVELRDHYFRQQRFVRRGALFLVFGLVATLLFARCAMVARTRFQVPKSSSTSHDQEADQNWLARFAAVVLAVLLTTVVFVYHFSSRQVLEAGLAESQRATQPVTNELKDVQPVVIPPPSMEEIARNWHRFRGPHGSGVAAFTDLPESWDGATGKGVLWKTAIELPGVSSPIIWEKRIFLTGASDERREIYCVDAAQGKLLWTKSVANASGSSVAVEPTTGYAAPTPATDGRRVYAIFASGDLIACDFEGNQLWTRSFGNLENPYGHASSLATYRDWVIVQIDQGSPSEKKSRLLAIQGLTGETVWEAEREVSASWSTPIVVELEGVSRIITAGEPWVIAYAADDGRELWRADCLQGDVGPSPIYSEGVVYVANDNAQIAAIRDGGQGDVSESHIVWTAVDGLPDICSPIVVDQLLLLAPSYGGLVSYDREKGGDEPLWVEEFDAGFMTSPSRVGDRVYMIGDEGRGWVFATSEAGVERIVENDIGEMCYACPAFQPGRIYIRGEKHLFCVGQE